MKKILTVLGARPQFIKAAAFSRAIKNYPNIEEVIIHTGQHYDQNMSDIFFQEMDIPTPQYQLKTGGQTHGAMTGQQLEKIEEILFIEKPDIVLVYGDTNSTLAGALAAVKLHIPVAHVEAGLRSYNREMPEEINRILTDQISSYLFVPTIGSKHNLIKEGIDESKIYIVGDIMYDAALFYRNKAKQPYWFKKLKLDNFVLCTIHRAENTNEKENLVNIFKGLASSKTPIILPLHPRTKSKIIDFDLVIPQNVFLTPPASYLEMVWLEMNCEIVVTDSGGVQKEAYFHKKFCLTLRDETEWIELVESGKNILCGTNEIEISNGLVRTDTSSSYANLYGSGNTAHEILRVFK